VNLPNRIGLWVTGSNVSTGSDADGIFVDASFAPSSNITNAASIGLYPTMAPPGGVTISNGYGLYIASGTFSGAGAVTTGYGLFVTAPTIATTNITAQLDNIRLDSNTISATNSNGTLTVVSDGTGALNIGTNATAHTTTLGSTTTTATTGIQSGSGGITVATSSNGTFGLTTGTGTISISTDATATTLNIGTGGGVKSTFLGSTNSSSATTVQSGSGALNVTSTNGALTINSGTGALTISGDSAATTVAIAQGGAVKTLSMGSTNTTSVTTIECGTGGCSVGASANAHTTTLGSTTTTSTTTIACGTGGCNVGTSANAHATTVGSTTASATTVIQAPTGGVSMTGVASVAVANLNVVTINTSTGQLGSQAASSGDVTGPGSSTDNALVRFDGATGKIIQNGVITEDDTGNLSITAAVSGGDLSAIVSNTSNTASARAFYQAQVAGSTASDAFIETNISGGQAWTFGLDNSDSDAFAISSNATLGTTNVMRVATTGEINYPLQSAFFAYLAGTASNVTGDGTTYTIAFDSELYDQNSDFNTGTSTFTAPVTGKYLMTGFLYFTDFSVAMTQAYLNLVTTGGTYQLLTVNPFTMAGNGILNLTWCITVPMTATNTATVNITVVSGTKIVDIVGGATATSWQGTLLC
jgi:hypothetical protein